MPGQVDHIEQVAGQAHRLIEVGDLRGAQVILRDVLAGVSPEPAYATGSVAEAAVLYARVLSALDEPGIARQWAAFAHTASRRLYGSGDERTLQAASILAAVLHRVGAYSRAAHLYRDLVDRLGTVDGAESPRALAARADLATVLHARGECATARSMLDKAWATYRDRYGDGQPVGIKMLARLAAMERDCGLTSVSQQHFDWAEELCRQYLPRNTRMLEQISALARTPADPRHVCADPLSPNENDEELDYATDYAGSTPIHEDDYGDYPEAAAAPPYTTRPPADPPYTPPPQPAEPFHAEPAPFYAAPAPAEPAYADGQHSYPGQGRNGNGQAAEWWPPETTAPVTEEEPGAAPWPRRPMATAPEDERLYVPQQREAGSALSRQRTADVAVRPPAEVVPAASPRHLTGGSRAGRGGRPELRLALIAVLAVIIIAVVTIATGALIAQVRSRSQGGTRPPGSQPTVQNPGGAGNQGSPAPLGPPTDLKLVDNATSIVLSWRYPAGAEGPVILSAGRPNEARHAFQTLAAGSQTFTVYSLPQTANYCFTVSIAYSTDDVAMSSPVCTARPGG